MDSIIWQSFSQKLWAPIEYFTKEDDQSTQASNSEYDNPLRRGRVSPVHEFEDKLSFSPVENSKKKVYNQSLHSKRPLKHKISTKMTEAVDPSLDMYLFCSNFTKKVKLSETTYKRTIIPLQPICVS
jgi:hypothetical protein